MLVAVLALSAGLYAPAAVRVGGVRPSLARSASPKLQELSPYEEWVRKRGLDVGVAAVATPPAVSTPVTPAVPAMPDLPDTTDLTGTVVPSGVKPPRRVVQKPPMREMILESSDLLSHQAIMENFVHHNPWEALQNKEFAAALDEVDVKSAYTSPAERLSTVVPLDPRVRANKAVAELGASFLDRGLAKWEPPNRERGFLYFFASLEGLGGVPWRHSARLAAKRIIDKMDSRPDRDPAEIALRFIEEDLRELESDFSLWTQTTRAMLMDQPGWAGMFKRMEEHMSERPQKCLDGMCVPLPVSLIEFVAVHSILTTSSIKALAMKEGWKPESTALHTYLSRVSTKRRGERPLFGMGNDVQSLQNPSGLAHKNQNFDRFEELEAEYEKVTIRALNSAPSLAFKPVSKVRANLQFFTCFDEREESFRRYIEALADDPTDIETFGVAGFFNMAIRYKSDDMRPVEILAPEGNFPLERNKMTVRQRTRGYLERKKLLAELTLAYERASFSPIGSIVISGAMLPISAGGLLLKSVSPAATVALEDAFSSAVLPVSDTDFLPPFNTEEFASRLAQLFKNVGTTREQDFARLVTLTGHGARSVNNPYLAAYNCGACCGREGGPNARVTARAANDAPVRALLRSQHGVNIPDDTWFIGGYHDTTSDLVELYDLDRVPPTHERDVARARAILDRARGQNALERCSKFFLADHVKTPDQALDHVRMRARDVAEPRPELGHSTNAAVIVGRRELTKGKFMDRRPFLPSYDPFIDDDRGTNLETVLTPALVVGSGISLEYFFSAVDGGAGTKAPTNVVGNFALQQGTAGDLLIGLATQMSELHTPIRAFYLVDAPVARVEAVLGRNKKLEDIVRNKWVKFFVRDPKTQQIYREDRGRYLPVDTMDDTITPLPDHVPFTEHEQYCKKVKKQEDAFTVAALGLITISALLPLFPDGIQNFDLAMLPAVLDAIDPIQAVVTTSAALLGASSVAFSRRYLHGEFMYGRMQMFSAGMVLGFNLVAVAPTLEQVAIGWTLIGYCSTFLIGGFNDRPTARDNAAYAFLIYQLSDAALLTAIAFSAENDAAVANPELAAAGLLVASALKSSQFPVSGLFLRSMEGASPNSALGYAALSAHIPVVLLAQTMPMWFEFEWARAALAAVGIVTAVQATLIANVRADRKGSIASATAATVGVIFVVLAAGYDEAALLLALGHSCFRMNQILRSPSAIQDSSAWQAALGSEATAPERVFDVVWKAGWAFNRINFDIFRLPDQFYGVDLKRPLNFYNAKGTQLAITATFVAFIAAFHLPQVDERVAELMQTEPLLAAGLLTLNVLGSTALIRFLFGNVLDFGRFNSDRTQT